MFAVGKLGSYISKGVSTVSGTFQPFGGAVDIVVVEQPDGTFKSSPWYVRFGKFQGVLKASEKVVSITVNGVEADFNMFLDHKGDAFFLREVEVDGGEFDPYVSSGDEMDVNAELWTVRKSKSCNFGANGKDFVSELETNNGKSNSCRGKLFGFSLGRRPAKGKGFEGTTDSHVIERANSVECAKLAADLLEVRWTTNSRVSEPKLPPSRSKVKVVGKVADKDGLKSNDSFVHGDDPDKVFSSISNEGINKIEVKVPTSMNTQNHDKAENTLYTPSLSASTCDSDTSDKSDTYENLIHEDDVMGKSDAKVFSSISPSNDSEDEQFSFSDLDDQNVDKSLEPELSSFRREKGLSQDFSERSENAVSETYVSDDKLHQVLCKFDQGDNVHLSSKGNSNTMSNPIDIVKLPITESMPNMLEGVGVSSYGCQERLGHSLDSNLESIKIFNDMLGTSKGNSTQQQVEHIHLETFDSHISKDLRKIISNPSVELSLCRHLLYEGMGYEAAAVAFDAQKMDIDKEFSLNPEISKNDKLVLRIGGLYFPSDAAFFISPVIDSLEKEIIMEPKGMIVVGQVGDGKSSEEMTQILMNSQSGSWKIWPFLFKRSNGIQKKSVNSEPPFRNSSGSTEWMDSGRPKVAKRKIRTKAPISEQLASLKLKDGKNEVTFTFSTAMLGKQQVDARIFLWKWNTRIVISDVDGTITKSDVLGQFMPLMGMDWSQTGVTHLFSAIKENGYQLLFLSARSISQAYYTRQFLFNLKQDGKELPEGPIIISPDGLFPSLYREVIRRAPHEFKISCLEDIKVLFPPDHSPFYAGFGNRDTDEISYLRVGIPIGKIFIINPKGQIAVNRRVDTKSYTSLHSLVHGMFPPAPPSEKEDYNSWNFWRIPPPDVI